jgi:hypothetical protein
MNGKATMMRPRAYVRSTVLLLRALMGSGTWWLLPLTAALILTALIFALLGAAGPLAPFVYPLF